MAWGEVCGEGVPLEGEGICFGGTVLVGGCKGDGGFGGFVESINGDLVGGFLLGVGICEDLSVVLSVNGDGDFGWGGGFEECQG